MSNACYQIARMVNCPIKIEKNHSVAVDGNCGIKQGDMDGIGCKINRFENVTVHEKSTEILNKKYQVNEKPMNNYINIGNIKNLDTNMISDSAKGIDELAQVNEKLKNLEFEKSVYYDRNLFICSIEPALGQDEWDIGREIGRENATRCEDLLHEYLQEDGIKQLPAPFELRLNMISTVPIYQPPRRLSYYEKTEVDNMVDSLIEQGIVRPSDSPYASPIVLVKKKTGELRMCVDYRALNKMTHRDNYPLPLIDDCLDYLERKKVFSIFDLKNGFH